MIYWSTAGRRRIIFASRSRAKALEAHLMRVGAKKCRVFVKHEVLLGMSVSQKGLRLGLERLERVRTWPSPRTLTALRSFVRLLQFFLILRLLTAAEENYTANYRKLLELNYFLKSFRCYL